MSIPEAELMPEIRSEPSRNGVESSDDSGQWRRSE
jgi:hypothetical protein